MAGQARDGSTNASDPGDDTAWPAAHPAQRATRSPATTDGIWRPEAGAGLVIGGVLFALAMLTSLVAFREVLTSPGVLKVLWLALGLGALAGAVAVASILLRLRSLRYILGPDALIVQRRGLRIAIPYQAIDRVVLRPRDRIDIAGYERYWPGYYDALTPTSEGPWRSLATTPANRRVRIQTGGNQPTLAISPERPVLFVEALENRRRLAGRPREAVSEPPAPEIEPAYIPSQPARPVPQPSADVPAELPVEARRQRLPQRARPEMPAWLGKPQAWVLFRERIVRGDSVASNLLALSLIALIVLVTLTAWRADAVSTPIAVRWDAAGEAVEHVRPDGFWVFEGVWIFPVTAAAVIAINAALATLVAYEARLREARMLLATALPVELVLMLALWRATS